MKKSMYSLILTEAVVDEIDRLAYESGSNRSAFIDAILADYCRMITPEMRIKNIFEGILNLCEGSRFLPSKEPNSGIMTLKTSLDYKYHPTVKYDLQLYRHRGYAFGQLKITMRSQSVELLKFLGEFFSLFSAIEEKYAQSPNRRGVFTFDGARFTRTLVLPEMREYDANDIAAAINSYVLMIDEMLNSFFAGKYVNTLDMEKDYLRLARRMKLNI